MVEWSIRRKLKQSQRFQLDAKLKTFFLEVCLKLIKSGLLFSIYPRQIRKIVKRPVMVPKIYFVWQMLRKDMHTLRHCEELQFPVRRNKEPLERQCSFFKIRSKTFHDRPYLIMKRIHTLSIQLNKNQHYQNNVELLWVKQKFLNLKHIFDDFLNHKSTRLK